MLLVHYSAHVNYGIISGMCEDLFANADRYTDRTAIANVACNAGRKLIIVMLQGAALISRYSLWRTHPIQLLISIAIKYNGTTLFVM